MNLRDQIVDDLTKSVSGVVGKWVGRVEVFRSDKVEHGDYSTNLALRLAQGKLLIKRDGYQSAIEIAKKLADSMESQAYIEKSEVKEPGFINFYIKDQVWQEQVSDVIKVGFKYGSNQLGKGKKARIEFISANPTGPLHFGNARGGPIGDSLASVLEFSGYKVMREYYHNDVGVQVSKLGQSLLHVASGEPLSEQEYKGEYIRKLVKDVFAPEIIKRIGSTTSIALDLDKLGKEAVQKLLSGIIKDCGDMGIKFDNIQTESELIKSGKTKAGVKILQNKKALKVKDEATWFAPHDKWLEDRETVIIKSNGDFTYFANDIAYHKIKFDSKPDLVVDVFGANHHGHVPRLKAVIESMGYDTDKFHVILYQWVRFLKGTRLTSMSKRAGTIVTAREVLDAVGKDALRFFILMHDASTHIDFDLDLAREKSSKNPVYYVQYAHARIVSILKRADKKQETRNKKPNYELLTTNYELNLIKQISKLPELVEDIAESFAVNQLTTYATGLADSFHKFYENVQVLTEDQETRDSRLALISATQITLANTLKLLGISAPKKM